MNILRRLINMTNKNESHNSAENFSSTKVFACRSHTQIKAMCQTLSVTAFSINECH